MTPAERAMPTIPGRVVAFGDGFVWEGDFPDGPRSYPSRAALDSAAKRAGSVVLFESGIRVSPLRTPRSTTHAVGAAAASSSRSPDTRVADPPFGAGAVPSDGHATRSRARAGNRRASGSTSERA